MHLSARQLTAAGLIVAGIFVEIYWQVFVRLVDALDQ